MATLVTGGTGFVGSNIVRALAERGHEVVVYDLTEPNQLFTKYVEPWADRVSFVQGSVLDMDALGRLKDSFAINKVVHAAYYTPGSKEKSDSRRVLETNIMGSINVLDTARLIGVDRFLFVSSGSIYADMVSPGPKQEEAILLPSRLYRLSKFTCERIIERYSEIHEMDTVAVRIGAPYGPMERATDYNANTSLLFEWTGKAMRGEPIQVEDWAAGSITYVMDIAYGICTVLDAANLPNRLYNLSSGAYTSTSQLVSAFLAAYPSADFVKPIPEDKEPPATGMVDVSRIKRDLGFEATTEPGVGLKAYFEWRIANGDSD